MKLPFLDKKSFIFSISLILIAVIGFNAHRKNTSAHEIEKSVQSSQEMLYLSEQVLYSVEHIVLNTRGYILTGDPAFIKPLKSSRIDILNDINSLKKLTSKRSQHLKIDTLVSLVEERIEFSRRFIESRKSNKLSETQRSVTVNRGEDLMEEIRNTIRSFQAAEKKALKIFQAEHKNSLSAFNNSLLLLLVMLIVLLGVIFFSFSKNAGLKAKSTLEIQKNHLSLQTILNTISEGVAVVDKNGDYVLFNPAAETILGMNAKDVGRNNRSSTFGLFYPDTLDPLEPTNTPLNRVLKGEEIDQTELFIRNHNLSDGAYLTISGRPIKTDGVNITGAVVVFHDSSERKKQQDEILQLNKQLEQRVNERTAELSAAIENLKRNEELLKETGAMAKVGGWEIFPESMTMSWTDELFGYT